MMSLTEKAMLIRLNITQWTARKADKKATAEVHQNHNIQRAEWGGYSKSLVAREALEKIKKVANEARTFHYANTLPWRDDGARILPAANYLTYSQKMRDLENAFNLAVSQFEADYPGFVAQAQAELNGLFNPDDYPPAADIKAKFAFAVSVDPLPSAADFRVSLAEDERAAIQADIETRTQAATAQAMRDLWQRLYDSVAHVAERLSDPDNIFRDSLINNLIELTDLLPRLNLADDTALAGLADKVKADLCAHKPEAIRTNEKTRQTVRDNAQAILDSMAGYFGEAK
jgi:hypothetical protein